MDVTLKILEDFSNCFKLIYVGSVVDLQPAGSFAIALQRIPYSTD